MNQLLPVKGIVILVYMGHLMLSPFRTNAQEMPPLNVIIHDSASTQGYYFMAPYRTMPPYTYSHPQLILDRYGRIMYYCVFPYLNISSTTTEDFKIQPDGSMSYFSSALNYFCLMDSTFTVVDSMGVTNGFLIDMHDYQILPDNHALMLAQEIRLMNLTSYHYFGINHSNPGGANAEVTGVVIQEFDGDKNLVWEWKSHDHFDFSDVDSIWLLNPNKVDWTHSNAVEKDADGNILLSSRHFNEITKIDYQTGTIIWRLGGKRNQFTFTNDPLRFNGQHDIRRLPNGNITLYDNGRYHNPPLARALEYSLDEVSLTATLVWEYFPDSALYSIALGNFQTLENGNRLIDFGNLSGTFPWMVVVKPDKSKVLEISCPGGYTSYRAFNYLTLPWELSRPIVDCYQLNDMFYLEAEAGYPSYLWSTGATTQAIPVTDTGEYWVFVPLGEGFISSEIIRVTDPANPCLYLTDQPAVPKESIGFQCIPNPVSGIASILIDLPSEMEISVFMTDLTGKTIFTTPPKKSGQGKHMIPLNVSGFSEGIYFLQLRAGDFFIIRKIIIL